MTVVFQGAHWCPWAVPRRGVAPSGCEIQPLQGPAGTCSSFHTFLSTSLPSFVVLSTLPPTPPLPFLTFPSCIAELHILTCTASLSAPEAGNFAHSFHWRRSLKDNSLHSLNLHFTENTLIKTTRLTLLRNGSITFCFYIELNG